MTKERNNYHSAAPMGHAVGEANNRMTICNNIDKRLSETRVFATGKTSGSKNARFAALLAID